MTNLARLVDRSVVRYGEASDFFDQWLEGRHEGYESPRFRAVSAIEECVTLTHRAFLHGQELANLEVIAKVRLPTESDMLPIRNMRNAIQHTEERILGQRKPHITQGEYFFPAFGDIAIELGSQALAYDLLARIISELHAAVGAPAR